MKLLQGMGSAERIRLLCIASGINLVCLEQEEARALLNHVRVLGDCGKLRDRTVDGLIVMLRLMQQAQG